MNWKCFFGLHKWSKWEIDPVWGVFRVDSAGSKRQVADIQKRHCEECGLTERRKVYASH